MPEKKSTATAISDDLKGTVSWKAQMGYSILAKEDSNFCLTLKFFICILGEEAIRYEKNHEKWPYLNYF